MSPFAAGNLRFISTDNAAMTIGRYLCLLSGFVTATALAQTHPQKQQPWCDFELPNCPAKQQGLPSSTDTRKTGMDSPGWGKGIMEMPYGTADSVAEVKSRLADEVTDCVSVAHDIQQANNYHRARSSHPELAASSCVILDPEPSYYGGFVNTCDYRVEFRFCAFRPDKEAWTEAFDCEKTAGGTELIEPRQHLAAHTKNAQMIYWGGCRFPKGSPTDFEFRQGEGYQFRCFAWDDPEQEISPPVKLRHGCDALAIENAIRKDENARRLEAEQHRLEAEQRRRNEQLALEEREKAERAAALQWQRDVEAAARRQAVTNSRQPAPMRPANEKPAPHGNYCESELQALYNAYLRAPQPADEQRLRSGHQGQEEFFRVVFVNNQNELSGYTLKTYGTRPDINNPAHLRKFAEYGQGYSNYAPLVWAVCYARARADQIERAGR